MTLNQLVQDATTYNQQRLHTNFQEQEILDFLNWLHKRYGVEYAMPTATHQNIPEKMLT